MKLSSLTQTAALLPYQTVKSANSHLAAQCLDGTMLERFRMQDIGL